MLFRTNAQSEAFESALAAAGVAYLVRGGERFFARREVRQGDAAAARCGPRATTASVPLPRARPRRARRCRVDRARRRAPVGRSASGGSRCTALAALADDLVAVSARGAASPDLVRELDERIAAQHAPTVQGVTLASLHAAKGLEWDTVFLVGCSDGFIPITLAEGPAAIEEERRLLYVGVTRARRDLRLSWAAARNPGGRASRRPSRFLDPAAAVLGPGAKAPESGSRRRRDAAPTRSTPATCRSCGTELTTAAQRKVGRCDACPPTYDETTFEALRTWRLAVARATAVPAYVVFTDATLVAIAETRPDSLAELAADLRGRASASSRPTVPPSSRSSAGPIRNSSPRTPLPQRNPRRTPRPPKRSHGIAINSVVVSHGARYPLSTYPCVVWHPHLSPSRPRGGVTLMESNSTMTSGAVDTTCAHARVWRDRLQPGTRLLADLVVTVQGTTLPIPAPARPALSGGSPSRTPRRLTSATTIQLHGCPTVPHR